MTDPRIAPVEDNLVAYFARLPESGQVTVADDADVLSWSSPYPHPLLNGVVGPHFAPGQVERRAREVLAPHLERGLPFLWWATPSGHVDELRPVLLEVGMTEVEIPGMYVALDAPVEVAAFPGLEVREVERDELPATLAVMNEVFEIPEELAGVFEVAFETMHDLGSPTVGAWLDGEAVGCSTAWLEGDTVGLYNIGTRESVRGRGVGRAVTAALMNAGLARGCDRAILHASTAGLGVYRRLGFEAVCEVPQFVWLPA